MKPKKLVKPEDRSKWPELFVEICESCVHSETEDGDWGFTTETWESNVNRVSRNKDYLSRWNFRAFRVPQEVYDAAIVYVVSVVYSTGCTFSNISGKRAVAFITENAEEALDFKKALEKDDGNLAVEYRDHPKNVEQGYCTWNGYFERVEYIECDVFNVM